MAENVIACLDLLCNKILVCKKSGGCTLHRKANERNVPDVRMKFDPDSGRMTLTCESFEEKAEENS